MGIECCAVRIVIYFYGNRLATTTARPPPINYAGINVRWAWKHDARHGTASMRCVSIFLRTIFCCCCEQSFSSFSLFIAMATALGLTAIPKWDFSHWRLVRTLSQQCRTKTKIYWYKSNTQNTIKYAEFCVDKFTDDNELRLMFECRHSKNGDQHLRVYQPYYVLSTVNIYTKYWHRGD